MYSENIVSEAAASTGGAITHALQHKLLNVNAKMNISNTSVSDNSSITPVHEHPHTAYLIRLTTDDELLAKAECVYTTKQLKSKKYTLDSGIFGASPMNSICSVCFQRIENCIGHFSVAQLPFPIVKDLCIKDLKIILPLICPCCSKLIIPNASDAFRVPVKERIAFIKKETEKYLKSKRFTGICIHCMSEMEPIKCCDFEPVLRYRVDLSYNKSLNLSSEEIKRKSQIQLNPCIIADILSNFTQIEELGYSSNFHPKDYMTYYIPIVPTKLRPKSIITTESTITGYYRMLIEVIIPDLYNLKQSMSARNYDVYIDSGEIQNKFNQLYDKMNAFYMLITDINTERVKETSLNLADKRDRKHIDSHNALMGRFKDKEKSIFSKGIVATRHNVSARTVLGGAEDAQIKQISVPYHVANKLSMNYPVYKQNLKFMQHLVARNADTNIMDDIHKVRVVGIFPCEMDGRENKMIKVDSTNAIEKALSLRPGDKVAISLMNTDIVSHSRFPIVREESYSTFQVVKDDNDIVRIPLATCAMKMADMDGDETQIYAASAHYLDIESLLLNSPFAQFIQYKDGTPGHWLPWSGDAAYGLQKIEKDRKCIIWDDAAHEEYSVMDRVNSLLPPDLCYKDSKIEIRNGKILSDKPVLRNTELFKYICAMYGNDVAIRLIDDLMQVAYDVNRDEGCTLGYDIRIGTSEAKNKIKALIKQTEDEMRQNELSNDPMKDIKQLMAVEKQKVEIKKILIDAAKGTPIDKQGYTTLRQEEFYQTVALADSVNIEGTRVQPVLANGTRTCSAFPRDSLDPTAYGYIGNCYNEGLSAVNHFFESKQHRFNIFQKGDGTQVQGYMGKRLVVNYGRNYMDFNAGVVNDGLNVSMVYGNCGLNPRLCVNLPLTDIGLSSSEFQKKYSKDKSLIELHKNINNVYRRYTYGTSFTKDSVKNDSFVSGFDYAQFINNADDRKTSDYITVDDFITELRTIYVPAYRNLKNKSSEDVFDTNSLNFSIQGQLLLKLQNLIQHEYYFRIMFYNQKIPKYLSDEILDKFKWSLADGGDPVGYKSCLAASEPLVQASLHAIHSLGASADVERIERSVGIDRFEELLGGNKHAHIICTIKLNEDTKENCNAFAREHETFYINDIWTDMKLVSCNETVPEFIRKLHPSIDFSGVQVANSYIIMDVDLSELSGYGVNASSVIDRLHEQNEDICFITAHMIESTMDFYMARMYIFFNPKLSNIYVSAFMDQLCLYKSQNVINGGYLKHCFVYESKNQPGHFLIDANEALNDGKALDALIFDERVDPCGCKSSDTNATVRLFGVCEANARHYEELIYTCEKFSATRGLLSRHYKLLSDATFVNGAPEYGSRNSLKHDTSIDAMRLMNFEVTKDMVQQALRYGDIQEIKDPISANVFGELPRLGTGVSKITLC